MKTDYNSRLFRVMSKDLAKNEVNQPTLGG